MGLRYFLQAETLEVLVHVRAIDEKYLMPGFQKVANRMAAGLILAAIIIGAALMTQVQAPQLTIFGYPGTAMIFFFIAELEAYFLHG